MSNTENSKQFVWRPNDNSATTNLKYDLEASHWVEAMGGTEKPEPIKSQTEKYGLGDTLSFLADTILEFFEVLFSKRKVKYVDRKTKKPLTDAEVAAYLADKKNNSSSKSNS